MFIQKVQAKYNIKNSFVLHLLLSKQINKQWFQSRFKMQHLGKVIFNKLYLFIAELDKYKRGNNKQETTGNDEEWVSKYKNDSFEEFKEL